MPIFEYRCVHCGRTIEKIQRQPLTNIPCPACGEAATRTVSLTSVAAPAGASCSTPAGSGFT